jgi:CRP/FNR family transcriptional regulator, cyclic AMP receptor protein
MAKSSLTPRSLFSALPTDLSAGLFANARPVRLKADQLLFVAGDPADGCYRIEQGLLKVTAMSLAGRERILAILGCGSVVGELSMIDGGARSAAVTAVRDSALSFVSRANFDAFAQQHPQIYQDLMAILARRLRDTNTVIAATAFLSLKGRVAQALLSLAEAFGHDVGAGRIVIRQKLDQSDLAAMAGVARENVSRILNEWKRSAVVSRFSGYYCLESRAVLEREAEL